MSHVHFSIEQLHHFQCGACSGWWSIGDAPPRDHWYCPWCGTQLINAGPLPPLAANVDVAESPSSSLVLNDGLAID
ncbi:hypothetical protein [Herpetosiphon giganteus]|uniref:hypothetical protein n=1 Tax=Herpetosiphon giganteus TaxID=2029754 RepID=UPI001959D542|nr:hypothetical protein [Herpetosiphon giganteus]MBM7843917.1 hypothetical protein [Herpetosiphon giganteus]